MKLEFGWENEALGLVVFLYGLLALKGFFTYSILINSGKMLWRSLFEFWWVLHCEFFQHELKIFPIRKAVAESIRKKWSMFPESAFVLSEMEKIEVVKLLFNSHHGILWLLSISKKYFSVLRERHSLHATSLTNLGLINNCWGRTKEERCLSLRAKYKGRG